MDPATREERSAAVTARIGAILALGSGSMLVAALLFAAVFLRASGPVWRPAGPASLGPTPRGFDQPVRLGGEVVSAELLRQGERDYLVYCRPCHGDRGDGKGPAARGMRPPPRDFTAGSFKFASVPAGALPRDDDLVRVVRDGLNGTAMLGWKDIPAPVLGGIVQYIKTFAPRWRDEVPGEAIQAPADPFAADPAAGVARGRAIYHVVAQCLACHPAYASRQEIDDDARRLTGRPAGELRPDPHRSELKDSDYGGKILPPDFTFTLLRSVRPSHRLSDLFRVIAAGVGGTAMPTWKGSLPDEDIWALAHYVDSLVASRGTAAATELWRRNRAARPFTGGLMSPLRTAAMSLSVLFALGAPPGPAHAYEVVAVAGGGTIKGVVTYRGPVATKKVVPTKDRAVCGDGRDEPDVVVGADKAVQGAVVYLKKVEKGKAWDRPARTPEVVNQACVFEPHVQAVPVGSTVAVVNADQLMHNTYAYAGKLRVFNLALPVKGQRIEKPVASAGLLRVGCDVHTWMQAWIYAADNPYYAVTAADGAFTLTEVPPGHYTLVAWQESLGETEVAVTVAPKRTAQANVELTKK